MWQSGWRIGGSDKCEFSLSGGIFEIHEGVGEGREAVGYSVVDAAV